MGCRVCVEGAERTGNTPSLAGDWRPITEIGFPIGRWVPVNDDPPPFLICGPCRTIWRVDWDPRDQIYAQLVQLKPGAELLLRADIDVRQAVATAEQHPNVSGTLDRYLWDNQYDVAAAVDAMVAVVLARKTKSPSEWGSWLATLEQFLRSPHGKEGATVLLSRREALETLRRPPVTPLFLNRLAPVMDRATERARSRG